MTTRLRTVIEVAAQPSRSLGRSFNIIEREMDGVKDRIRDQQSTLRRLRREYDLYGSEGQDGTRDIRGEMLRTTNAIEGQRRALDRLTQEGREARRSLQGAASAGQGFRGTLTDLGIPGIGGLGAAGLAGGAAGLLGGGIALATSQVERARQIRRAQARAGLDAEQVQRLEFEFRALGLEDPRGAIEELREIQIRAAEGFEDFTQQQIEYQERVREALAAGEERPEAPDVPDRVRAFEIGGLNIEDFIDIAAADTRTALDQVIDAGNAIENAATRVFFFEEVLGGQLAEAAQVIAAADEDRRSRVRELADRQRIQSEEAIARAEEIGDEFELIRGDLEAARAVIGEAVIVAFGREGFVRRGIENIFERDVQPVLDAFEDVRNLFNFGTRQRGAGAVTNRGGGATFFDRAGIPDPVTAEATARAAVGADRPIEVNITNYNDVNPEGRSVDEVSTEIATRVLNRVQSAGGSR